MSILRKWLPGILAFLIVSVLSLQLIFYFFGARILKKSLLIAFSQYVTYAHPEAERLPSLDFETLRINLLSRNVVISNIAYQATFPLEKDAAKSTSLFIPKITLKGISFWKLYWQGMLDINTVRLSDPSIRIIQGAKLFRKNSMVYGEKNNFKRIVRQIFDDKLHAITFERLQIEDAHLEYSFVAEPLLPADIANIVPQHVVEKLSLEILNIHLDANVFNDTTSQRFAENVSLKLKNYHAMLSDSNYSIGIDTLAYASSNETLILKNISFLPENIGKTKSHKEQYFAMHIPSIELSEISPVKMLADKVLQLDTIIVHQPAIHLYGNFDRKNADHISSLGLKKFSADSLYSHIKNYLNFLSVNAFKLQHGTLQVHNIKDEKEVLFGIKQLNLVFDDLLLNDKQTQKDADGILPAKHIMMNLGEVRMATPDKMHIISSKAVMIETDANSSDVCNIIIDSVQVAPITDSLAGFFNLSALPINLGYDISIERVAFWSLDLEELARHKMIFVDSLLLSKPKTTVANFSKIPFGELASQHYAADTTQHKSLKEILYDWSHAQLDLHPVIAPGRPTALFYGLNVDTIQIDSGQFYFYKADYAKSTLKQVGSLEALTAGFQQVSINNRGGGPIEGHKVAVYAKDFNLHAHQGALHLPDDHGPTSGGTVHFSETYFSTTDAEGYVSNLHIWPDRKNTVASRNRLSQLFIPYAKVSGIDFEKFYRDQYGDIQYLHIIKPEIAIAIDEQQTTKSKSSLDLSVKNLYQWIAPYLNTVSLQNLAIENANLTVKKKNKHQSDFYDFFRVQSVDLTVKDFYIDTITRISTAKPFYTRDLNINAKNFALHIATESSGSPMTIRGKTAGFSSGNAGLQINDLSLRASETDERANYQADIQSVHVGFGNLYDYFMHNSLKLNRMEVHVPEFILKRYRKNSSASDTEALESIQKLQPDLYPYLDGLADELIINSLNIHQGVFEFAAYARDKNCYLLADTITVQADDIIIDEYSRSENKLGYAKEVDFYVHVDQGFLNLDSVSRLRISHVKMSSDNTQLTAGAFQYVPISGKQLLGRKIRKFSAGVTVDGIDYKEVLLKGNINLDKITFAHPEIALTVDQKQQPAILDKKPFKSIIGGLVNNISVRQVTAEDGELTLYHGEDTTAIQHINAYIDDVAVHPETLDQTINADLSLANVTRKLLFADNLTLEVDNYYQEDSLTSIEAEKVVLSTKSAQMKVSGLRYQPKYKGAELGSYYPYQKTWTDMHIPEIVMHDIDISHLVYHKFLKIGQTDILSPNIALFKDKSLEIDSLTIKPMPQDLLRQVKFPFTIGAVNITNGFISYEEKIPDVEQTGKITFEKFNAKVSGATNDHSFHGNNEFLKIEANAYLLGKAPLNVDLNFHLGSPEKLFSATGKMGKMDLSYLNVILEPASSIHVNRGLMHQMNFQFVGDQYASSGMMHCYYSDLHVMLIDRRTRAFGLDEKVGSFLANTFVIRADNPVKNSFRIGKISYERDATRGVSNYLWKSLLSGIKSSMGLVKKADKTKNFYGQKK